MNTLESQHALTSSPSLVDSLEQLPLEGDALRLFTSPEQWTHIAEVRAYAHYMRRAFDSEDADDELGINAILCIEDRPTIYFKEVAHYDRDAEAKLQQVLWNQGVAPLLVVTDPSEVRVYSAFVGPQINSQSDKNPTIGSLVESLERAAFALETRDWIRRVETGQIYQDPKNSEKFRQDNAVDHVLLRNLSDASDALCRDANSEHRLERRTAHALLGRILFVAYLCDRGIIDPDYFPFLKTEETNKGSLRGLLNSAASWEQKRDRLYELFELLQQDFNGSLLNEKLHAEKAMLREEHLNVLTKLLNGDEVKTGQRSLFPFYDFKWIPIETISSIYESFISAEDKEEGRDDQNPQDESQDEPATVRQSQSGAYYTPRHLAEMAVDVATQGWPSLLDKKCLDPACGSGIFLVILFNRMAEEWRAKNPEADNLSRARALRELLKTQLCGVDVHQTACRIACFSLYLALFDQLNPRDIRSLKEQLESEGQKVLPPLLVTPELYDETNIPRVIFHANFFKCEARLFGPGALGDFDLIIGNPPWKGRNQDEDKATRQWLFSDSNPFKSKFKGKDQDSVFFPQRQSAIAFMWKVPLHLKPEGRGCLVLPSKVFLSKSDAFQGAWLRRFAVERVLQLADYRRFLFENAKNPAMIVTFRRTPPDDGEHIIHYDTPKVERIDPRHAVIPILPDDQKQLTVGEVLLSVERGEAALTWKKWFRGTGRDVALIDRLLRFPRLDKIAGKPEENKRWIKGQGFKPFIEESYKRNPKKYGEPKERWWNDTALFVDAGNKKIDLVLSKSDCQEVSSNYARLHRLPDRRLFQPPMVLVNHSFTRIVFCDFPVLFRHALQSFSGRKKDKENKELLLFLAGVFHSPLPFYFLFHTSANWGVERNDIHLDEMLRCPFPLPDDTVNPAKSWDIVRKVATRIMDAKERVEENVLGRQNEIESAKSDITEWVFDYYGLRSWERVLVEDTVKIYEPSSTPHSISADIKTLHPSTEDNRREYAAYLCDTLNAWAHRSPLRVSGRGLVARKSGLGLLTLSKAPKTQTYREDTASQEMQDVLQRIEKTLTIEGRRVSYVRGFTLFEKDAVHILKPLNLRHWTRSAAINDADALAGAFLTERK